MPTSLRRRSLLQATGASLGALSLRGFAIDKPAAAHFTHGIASGDPLAEFDDGRFWAFTGKIGVAF